MADLKAGTTVGGNLVWHQGNFPLKSVSDDVYYKDYKIYTEYNKPLAADNDFVSKAAGGTYSGKVTFNLGLNIKDRDGYIVSIAPSTAGQPYTVAARLNKTFAFETADGKPFILFNPLDDMASKRLVVMGPMTAGTVFDQSGQVFSPGNPPKAIDVGLGNVSNDAQVKIGIEALQTMKGPLAAPNFSSLNTATNGDHVPRLDQVITKGVIIDFGNY